VRQYDEKSYIEIKPGKYFYFCASEPN